MRRLAGTPIDQQNIALAKLVYALRQELDIYCLISVNVDSIKKRGVGKQFFWYLRNLAITAITLSICKIYEHEKEYQLNYISGIYKNLRNDAIIEEDNSKLREFIGKYNGPIRNNDLMNSFGKTIKKFKRRYKDQLNIFKTFRDKYAAHSQYGFPINSLPSYEVMENLYSFASDFCEVVFGQFIKSIFIKDLNLRVTKNSFKRLLQELGVNDIKTEMQ